MGMFHNKVIKRAFSHLVFAIRQDDQELSPTLQYFWREVFNQDLGPVLRLHFRILIYNLVRQFTFWNP